MHLTLMLLANIQKKKKYHLMCRSAEITASGPTAEKIELFMIQQVSCPHLCNLIRLTPMLN